MKITLKPGRDKSVRARHPWIFSGAVSQSDNFINGGIISVYAADGAFLGYGMGSKKSQIVCRMLSFDKTPAEDVVRLRIKEAIELRKQVISQNTTAYRLINAEGDFLPGLIVDRYGDSLVIQVSVAGIERLKPLIIDELVKQIKPLWIYEKSTSSSRKEEGMQLFEETIYGTPQEPITVLEEGIQFKVIPTVGQKTGFFIDQRAMRLMVQQYARGRDVLNCFCYSGGFTLHALKGGAKSVDSVDISQEAIDLVKEHITLNGFDSMQHKEYTADVFEFLKQSVQKYDFIILDPPAFAKRKADIKQAARGYKEINRLAIKDAPKDSLLLTCSCSYHIDETLFRQILFQAALDAKRDVQIIQKHHLAEDHPMNIYHPEGNYLKSFLCYIK
jgi:23S rRNA (cytosine1962-C5)-methyltransferase